MGRLDETDYYRMIHDRVGQYYRNELRAVLDAFLIEMYPGVEQLLKQLKPGGTQLACLSNTNIRHWHRMFVDERSDLRGVRCLDHTFASFLIGLRKPDLGMYQYVERMTDVSSEAILFFDDSLENCTAAGDCG